MSRLSYQTYPEALKPLFAMKAHIDKSGLEKSLTHLVMMRASQLNGCAYCMDMHSKEARADGETEQRLYVLQAWRETPFYSDRERAALAWCEAVTRLDPVHGVPDDVYEQARAQFSEKELMDLNLLVILINSWNRIAIPSKKEPDYQLPERKVA
ncbi:carboxymuconolactone decarboxylase family protein [Dyella nitratireducens]|uniref:Alkyl hydroperoxide reductase AhpD n=1 Tax=Dyella nitratireducens TaxID=1849580 RepID=A0ABQ1FJS7_9GAMM|nr:carboxymuconolactone decarboxylase family protein [Dyella nitratireducens]GGA19034.1 alkyl hydroperoxide reductase AhpD [Dyella nitratireducens]GLQ44572.1 alkyl hydroperoxide reductase AhpD [Dyella nitratireducens]